MQKISLATTYYNCPELAELFVETNLPHVDELIIVDDGSKESLSIDKVIKPSDKIKLFRLPVDLGFNSHGCRNLAMTKVTNNWVVMIDIDRQFIDPSYAYDIFRYKDNLRKDTRYRFVMHTEGLRDKMHYSVNDFLIHKDHFFTAGGYDEELVGIRAGDREYFKQLVSAGGREVPLHDIDIIMVRLCTYYQNDLLKERIKSPNDIGFFSNALPRLLKERIANPVTKKPILQFDWFEIT